MSTGILNRRSIRRAGGALRSLAPAGLALLALTACAESTATEAKSGTFYSDPVRIGNGTARTYVVRDTRGTIASLGLELSESALTGLPTQHTSLHIPFPKQASSTQYTFMMLDWRPGGHEPEHVYTVPHFDVHFFMMPEADVMKIPGGPDPIVPEPRYVPADYIAPGNMAEPGMGVHWADATSGEFNGKPFDKTFIYGYHRGELSFLEPMITKAYLETRPDFSMQVKQPQSFQRNGLYPLRHSIRYDAAAKVYRISIDELTRRTPAT